MEHTSALKPSRIAAGRDGGIMRSDDGEGLCAALDQQPEGFFYCARDHYAAWLLRSMITQVHKYIRDPSKSNGHCVIAKAVAIAS